MNTPAAQTMSDENRAAVTEDIVFPKRLGNPPEYAALAAHIIATRISTAPSSGSMRH